jgi:hypothetical protein
VLPVPVLLPVPVVACVWLIIMVMS